MADDPLRQQVMKFLDAQYPHARLADHQFAADSLLTIFAKADTLRALLLADEGRALEWLNEVTFNAVAKPGELPWATAHVWYREYWAVIKAKQHAALLAALREVAGL